MNIFNYKFERIIIKKGTFFSAVLSGLRLLAVIGIFCFHILGLYGRYNYELDFISIIIFCFLTGYLASNLRPTPAQWLKKKVLSIMVGYWLVIIPALIFNKTFGYKDTSLLGDLITFLGGNLFLEQKVYVIAWYITFILLLYAFLYLESYITMKYAKLGFWITALIGCELFFGKASYFLFFALGFFLSKWIAPPGKDILSKNKFCRILFNIQSYGYEFFLIHGGVLIFCVKLVKLPFHITMFAGFILSIIGSFFLHILSEKILMNLAR